MKNSNTTMARIEDIPLDEGFKVLGLDPEATTEWFIEQGYLYENSQGDILPTPAAINEGLFTVKEVHPDAIQSTVSIDDITGILRFHGPEGSVMFNPYAETNLRDIWVSLGAPHGLAPEIWIRKHGMEEYVWGTISEGNPTAPLCYLTSLVKDGPMVDYVVRMYEAQLFGAPGEPGCYLV